MKTMICNVLAYLLAFMGGLLLFTALEFLDLSKALFSDQKKQES